MHTIHEVNIYKTIDFECTHRHIYIYMYIYIFIYMYIYLYIGDSLKEIYSKNDIWEILVHPIWGERGAPGSVPPALGLSLTLSLFILVCIRMLLYNSQDYIHRIISWIFAHHKGNRKQGIRYTTWDCTWVVHKTPKTISNRCFIWNFHILYILNWK